MNTEHLKYDPKIYLRTMLRFCWEYNLSLDSKNINHRDILLKSNKVELLNNIEESVWGERPSNFSIDFTWITNVMPFEIYKQFLKSDELRSAKNLSADIINEKNKLQKTLDHVLESASESVEYLESIKTKAEELTETLLNVKREGNFKLLSNAFSTIRKNKRVEVIFAQCRIW